MGARSNPPGHLDVHDRVLGLQAVEADQFAAHFSQHPGFHALDADRGQTVSQPACVRVHLECVAAVHPHDLVDPVRKQEAAVVR